MIETRRIEEKYLLTLDEQIKYTHYFEQLLPKDKHSKAEGYTIRTLYFDTPGNQDYWDKINGIYTRRRLRLRCYGGKPNYALLEMKERQGKAQRKRSLHLDLTQGEAIARGDYKPLLLLQDSFALECYLRLTSELYRSKSLVEYTRIAFAPQENQTRITFDTNIRGCENVNSLLEPAPLVPIINPAYSILEVKYQGFLLGYIQQAINQINYSPRAISKYCHSRFLLT